MKKKYEEASQIMSFYTSSRNTSSQNDRYAFSMLDSAVSFEKAGDVMMALNSYRKVLEYRDLKVVDKKIAEEGIKSLRDQNKDLYENAEELILDRLDQLEALINRSRMNSRYPR